MSFGDLVERYDEVDSTMEVARLRANEGAVTGTTIVAATQRAGRGREGRAWISPRGASLSATVILRPSPRPDGSALTWAGLLSGVAVCHAVRELGVSSAALKWPNDVVVGEQKLCGILAEAFDVHTSAPLVLVGCGVNLAARASLVLPAEIAERYVGFADIVVTQDVVAADIVLAVLLKNFEYWYQRWLQEGAAPVRDAWHSLDSLRGVEVRAEARSGVVCGCAEGLAPSGALRVMVSGKVVEIAAGLVVRVRKS